jgi:hypothetical protein
VKLHFELNRRFASEHQNSRNLNWRADVNHLTGTMRAGSFDFDDSGFKYIGYSDGAYHSVSIADD